MENNRKPEQEKLLGNQTPLAAEKLWAAWREARKFTGQIIDSQPVNLAKTGELFYKSLFDPDSIDGDTDNQDSVTLKTPLPKRLTDVPGQNEFVRKFRHVMTNEVPFEKTFFPGAYEAVIEMLNIGPVRIWTTGDVFGIPELNLPGSYEQLKRLARGRWSKLRNKTGLNLDFIASEDKMKQLEKLARDFAIQNVKHIIIVDDKVGNLLSAKKRIQELIPNLHDVILVWDRESELAGYHADKDSKLPSDFQGTPQEAISQFDLIAVNSITEIVPRVRQKVIHPQGQIAWVIDHDDVISQDNKRVQLQEENVIKWLNPQNWV